MDSQSSPIGEHTMQQGPTFSRSLWVDTVEPSRYPRMTRDNLVDTAIIGAGMAGLNLALLLLQSGQRVAVIDMREVGSGVTANTTAKITALHGQLYTDITRRFGREAAALHGEANQNAIAQYEAVIKRYSIDCDFSHAPAWTVSNREEDMAALAAEADAARQSGLPASFSRDTGLPFGVSGGVKAENQARFHPLKYLLGIARELAGREVKIFENTRALDIRPGQPADVITDRGLLRAKHVVLATNIPFHRSSEFFLRMVQSRSYVLAYPVEPGFIPDAMYYQTRQPFRSLRLQTSGDRTWLLVGGEKHHSGHVTDTEACYARLAEWARETMGLENPVYRWSTHDQFPLDRLPYVGPVSRGQKNILAVTGFGGWGMSQSMVAAHLLRDLIYGVKNSLSRTYAVGRLKLSDLGPVAGQNLHKVRRLVSDRLSSPKTQAKDLEPSHGGLTKLDGSAVAAFRDEQGELHAVSRVCTHIGCVVQWNNAERSWDCPCHGSRFDIDGRVLHGPAVKDLQKKKS
ncbi:glycine/D-amino acid oxidase, deaminating [Desulfocurvibacter africanus PCS]|uniref:Glycine/D-amino acid oxidase, deaminating n=1 Tax=Desulfocurvibacter africanus PCS TaxID=1262666 RepID=M5Q0F2_DESAF|nr:FAD-dependent oxidoreductase [Desulfocurvibacter africanus]EMG35623.1 glycine/D-amino acid oxidase, deaminating [Desulfocurvibacter africanus PCS]